VFKVDAGIVPLHLPATTSAPSASSFATFSTFPSLLKYITKLAQYFVLLESFTSISNFHSLHLIVSRSLYLHASRKEAAFNSMAQFSTSHVFKLSTNFNSFHFEDLRRLWFVA